MEELHSQHKNWNDDIKTDTGIEDTNTTTQIQMMYSTKYTRSGIFLLCTLVVGILHHPRHLYHLSLQIESSNFGGRRILSRAGGNWHATQPAKEFPKNSPRICPEVPTSGQHAVKR